MAPSSLAPMRRLRISSLPAPVSKSHRPSCLTRGMGKGQPSAPSCSSCLESDAATRLTFSLTRFMNSSCSAAASTTSTDTRACPAGPKIACRALVSLASTAALRASTAASGETNRSSPAAMRVPGKSNKREMSTSLGVSSTDRGAGEELQYFIGYCSLLRWKDQRFPLLVGRLGASECAGADVWAGADAGRDIVGWRLSWPRVLNWWVSCELWRSEEHTSELQ